jgi:hypothetical protein
LSQVQGLEVLGKMQQSDKQELNAKFYKSKSMQKSMTNKTVKF